jgi:hypothetical protein
MVGEVWERIGLRVALQDVLEALSVDNGLVDREKACTSSSCCHRPLLWIDLEVRNRSWA